MLHKVTGRATKCGPSAISAIAGVPTHEAAAVIRRLFDRPSVNGVFIDELAAALEEFGWAPDYAMRHPKYRERRYARRVEVWDRIFAEVPFEVRAITLGTFLDPAPSGTWAISRRQSLRRLCDGFVADSAAWFHANRSSGSAPFPATTAWPCAASGRPSGSSGCPPGPSPATPVRRSADHAQGHRDHGLHHRRAFGRGEGSGPAPGIANPASTTSGTTSSTRISRRSARSSA